MWDVKSADFISLLNITSVPLGSNKSVKIKLISDVFVMVIWPWSYLHED